jgi:hypothetical protein
VADVLPAAEDVDDDEVVLPPEHAERPMSATAETPATANRLY